MPIRTRTEEVAFQDAQAVTMAKLMVAFGRQSRPGQIQPQSAIEISLLSPQSRQDLISSLGGLVT